MAQKMHVGPRIPVEIQLERAEFGRTSGPAWGMPHLVRRVRPRGADAALVKVRAVAGVVVLSYRPRRHGLWARQVLELKFTGLTQNLQVDPAFWVSPANFRCYYNVMQCLRRRTMQIGPCVPVGIQLQKAGVGPTSGPTWRLAHFEVGRVVHLGFSRIVASEIEVPNTLANLV